MDLRNKRVFVSGGAGVIGQEMIPRLVERGAIVLVGDLKPRPATFVPEVLYRQGDLNLMEAGELAAFGPEVFIHLAATFERSTESYEFWEENFWHNVRLSHHLATIIKDLPSLKRLVFASSYLIYDPVLYQFDSAQQEAVALKENDQVLPRNLTGMAKFSHEIELRFLDTFRSSQFNTVCARIFRGYGRNSRDVISRWIRALLNGESISVFRPEGLFDYLYAADSAEGLIRLAEATDVAGIINLGTGRARRVQDIVEILRDHFPSMRAETCESDIPFEASQADLSEFERRVGWKPVYDLEAAIPEMIAHERGKLAEGPATSAKAIKVLLSSASGKIPLLKALEKAARKIHPEAVVVAGDVSRGALAMRLAQESWVMPRTRDENLGELLQGCRERGITMVLPTRDGELEFWSKHVEPFRREGIHVITSPLGAIEKCLDKLAFSAFGLEASLPFIPSSLSPEVFQGCTFTVKERFGAGSRSIGLDLDLAAAMSHARTLDQPVFQPFIKGWEFSADAWLDRHGHVKGLVLRKRDVVVNGESQVTTTFRDQGIEAKVAGSLEALGLSGPVVLQAIVDSTGRFHILECNARFGGASTSAIAAGLDSLYWSLLEVQGVDVSAYPFPRIPGELQQIRVSMDTYHALHPSDI